MGGKDDAILGLLLKEGPLTPRYTLSNNPERRSNRLHLHLLDLKLIWKWRKLEELRSKSEEDW